MLMDIPGKRFSLFCRAKVLYYFLCLALKKYTTKFFSTIIVPNKKNTCVTELRAAKTRKGQSETRHFRAVVKYSQYEKTTEKTQKRRLTVPFEQSNYCTDEVWHRNCTRSPSENTVFYSPFY